MYFTQTVLATPNIAHYYGKHLRNYLAKQFHDVRISLLILLMDDCATTLAIILMLVVDISKGMA